MPSEAPARRSSRPPERKAASPDQTVAAHVRQQRLADRDHHRNHYPQRSEVRRIFGDFDRFFAERSRVFAPRADVGDRGWVPALEVSARNHALTIRLDLPGMKTEDVSITIAEEGLAIEGERKSEVNECGRTISCVSDAAPCVSRTSRAHSKGGPMKPLPVLVALTWVAAACRDQSPTTSPASAGPVAAPHATLAR